MRPRPHAIPASVAVAVALVVTMSACGSSDPLAISCSDYLAKDAATQLHLAATWGSPDREHVDPAADLVAPAYQKQLISYSGTHPDVKLSELELRMGF